LSCKVKLYKSVKKFLKKISKDLAERINKRLSELSKNPMCEEKLKGNLRDLCKSRVGSYRIAYLLKSCTIIVVDIDHGGRFYDKLRHLLKC